MMKITKKFVTKLLSVVDQGLVKGIGEPIPGKMCVEAAVCYAQGLPHNDKPTCVGSTVRSFKIKLNDADWSSNAARAAGMRKLAVAQLGSDSIDQLEFAKIMVEQTIRRIVPVVMRNAANTVPEHAEEFNNAAKDCEELGDLNAILTAERLTRHNNIYGLVNRCAYAAGCVNYHPSLAVNELVNGVIHISDLDNSELFTIADIGLQALIQLNSPGCKYLTLCD